MNTIGNLASPDRSTANEFSTVSFTQQEIAILKAITRHVLVWHVDRLDNLKIKPIALNVCDPKIGTGVGRVPGRGVGTERGARSEAPG
jgi:hypothetical protein